MNEQENNFGEIPTLTLRKVIKVADFTIEEIYIESKSFTYKDTEKGLNRLLIALNQISKSNYDNLK